MIFDLTRWTPSVIVLCLLFAAWVIGRIMITVIDHRKSKVASVPLSLVLDKFVELLTVHTQYFNTLQSRVQDMADNQLPPLVVKEATKVAARLMAEADLANQRLSNMPPTTATQLVLEADEVSRKLAETIAAARKLILKDANPTKSVDLPAANAAEQVTTTTTKTSTTSTTSSSADDMTP
jgi:hypothetical protein